MRLISNIFFLLVALNCCAQDSIVMKVPVGQPSGMISATLDTSSIPGFTIKTKALLTWSNVLSKPSTYTPATHSHPISDITNLQSSLDAKGTSNFDGAYSSLSGKPDLTLKVNVSDTASMLANYRAAMIANTAGLLLKVNITDTSGKWAAAVHTHTAASLGLGNVTNTSDANKPVSTAQQTALDLKANLASPTITGTAALPIVTMSGKITNYNGINTASNGVPSIVATIDLTGQTANINTSTLYAVPSAGFYRVNIYITVTSAGTTSTMPSTTITYTDGNAGTNSHSTTTTATNTGNSVTTTFAQTSYVLYAKASTNIQYATGGYASTGSAMQYALRIRVESL